MKHKARRNKSSARNRRKNNAEPVGKSHDANPTKSANTEPVEANNDEDLYGMKQWIESLTYDSLLNALEFTFQVDSDSAGNHRQQKRGNSASQEFDLLMEMLSAQSPDHNDQRFDEIENCSESRRSIRGKLETPYLFRWFDADSNRKCDSRKSKPAIEDPMASLATGATGMPAELMDVLAKAGVKRSTSALLETYNEADEEDEAFGSLGDCQNVPDAHPFPINFHVKAEQGILDDGTSLGRGTTSEQQNADRSMLLWTVFMRDKVFDTSDEQNLDRSRSQLPRCKLIIADEAERNVEEYKRIILDNLRLASRGKFLSRAAKKRHPYLAPWFDPTERWFSISMYLANRFEASLWDGYFQRCNPENETDSLNNNSLIHSMRSLDKYARDRVLCYALAYVIRDDIETKGKRESHSFDHFVGTILWKLLICNLNESCRSFPGTHGLSDRFAASPLLEWGTPLSELKSRVMEYIQEGLAHEAERLLMQSIPTEGSQKPKGKKKRKKRPKKRGHDSKGNAIEKLESAQIDHDESAESDDEPHVECILPSTPSETLADHSDDAVLDRSPQSEKNSAKMAVLQVLDEILCNVFIRLGVQEEEFSDFTDAVTVKSRGESTRRHVRSISLGKTLSIDGMEVASTALMSNKTCADAAMSFLQRTDNGRNSSLSSVQSQQLWASRMRRQTLEGQDDRNSVSHLKRSKSSGDGPLDKKRSPAQNPSKTYQPTPPRSSGSNAPLWPSSDSPLFLQSNQHETSIFDGAPLCLSGALDGWNGVACQKQNETSIFTDLLKNMEENADPSNNFASSTAVSIASSRGNVEDAGLDIDDDCVDSPLIEGETVYEADGGSLIDVNKAVQFKDIKVQNMNYDDPQAESPKQPCGNTLANSADINDFPKERINSPVADTIISDSPDGIELSPTISSPPTPPPQLSPILVSLADLGKLREEAASGEFKEKLELPSNPLPFHNFPKAPPRLKTLTPSRSRDDLRSIDECRRPPRRDRDDHHTMSHRQVDALLSYRNVVAQSVPRKPPSLKSYDGKQKHRDDGHPIMARSTRSIKTTKSGMWPPGPEFPNLSSSVSSMPSYKEPILNKVIDLCARSEGGLDAADDASHCNVIPRAQTDDTMTKDGATTISSVHSPPETEELATLKEERNSYRDMCLTLGAENAKLRNLLASKTCNPIYHPAPFTQEASTPYFYHNDQQMMWPTHIGFPNQFSTESIVAMSDAGIHRGDYDSLAMSEDGTDVHPSVVAIGGSQNSVSWQARGDSVQSFGRRTSGGGTYAESDASLEQNVGGQETHAISGLHRVHHQDSFFGPIPLHGIESRLSKDISRYMKALKSQLKKNEPRRLWAVEGITKVVKALWPRAQIKMYGSHMTKLCLPSSDMDFVISLPAVHKNAPATAPGDLEGRNAIIETNQKVLSRKLKSETWLDQRSIKVIERTAVPVIKVSTKDSRSRVVQLDLSFDAKEHHGLEALNMIQHILEQLPMVRPLVLVLKQFLLDRGLLTAYTGGLSSYCLFLMVARYCQEQAPTWNDCGSLLMGLLDFYGNFFDPRITGISVRTRQYFFRSQDAQSSTPPFTDVQGWSAHQQTQFPDLTKRNSFSSKPHRFQTLNRQFSFQNSQKSASQQFKSAKFDPIWVEDPLNPGNNVGRNAFRIFQVQRAFSDAHRALVASLEWDIDSMHDEFGDDGGYPLLKCLLQNEDVFFTTDDPIHR